MAESIAQDQSVTLRKYRFTVDDYHRMGEAGLFASNQRVELINGEIIEMSPINSPHAGAVKVLNHLLNQILSNQCIIGVQDPIKLSSYAEPEPDISICKFRSDFYSSSHPTPKDVLFLIEVADSSLDYDRQIKLPLYAEAGIPESWIVNLQDQQIEIYTQPSPEGYSQIRIFRKGESIQTIHIAELAVDAIFIGEKT